MVADGGSRRERRTGSPPPSSGADVVLRLRPGCRTRCSRSSGAGTTKGPPGSPDGPFVVAGTGPLIGRLGLGLLEELARLVVPALGDARELLLVLLAVVSAEEQLTVVELDSDVRLRTAAVTAIERGERELRLERIERAVICRTRHRDLLAVCIADLVRP